MNVRTTRSGVVLHGSSRCPDLRGKRVFVIDEQDALAHAVRCTRIECEVGFRYASAPEAQAA